MGNQLGIIAGSGAFPFLVIEEAQDLGYTCVVAAIKGAAEKSLRERVSILEWFDVDEISQAVSFFKKSGVHGAVLAGKVDYRLIYRKKSLGKNSPRLKDRTPATLLQAAIEYMAREGIKIKNPMDFLPSLLCEEGILTKTKSSADVEEDIDFGWQIAKNLADLDIGQTVVVKHRAVVAVEGIEGTDALIERGGKLAGEGTVVIKVARTQQDFRVDLPAIGLDTVKSLIKAGSRALCFESQKMAFFQKKEAIALADAHKISIIARGS